jgi:hypothetical protein
MRDTHHSNAGKSGSSAPSAKSTPAKTGKSAADSTSKADNTDRDQPAKVQPAYVDDVPKTDPLTDTPAKAE